MLDIPACAIPDEGESLSWYIDSTSRVLRHQHSLKFVHCWVLSTYHLNIKNKITYLYSVEIFEVQNVFLSVSSLKQFETLLRSMI